MLQRCIIFKILQICENFEWPSPFDYCGGRVELEINAFFKHSGSQRKQILETGSFDTKVYFKPTYTLELLHKKLHHPNHTFKGFIKSQILRYVRICNNKQDVMIACRNLFAALVRRGYSERFLRKIKDKTLCELRKKPNKGSSQRCTTRNCKLCSTQVVVESGNTMGGVLDAGNQIQIPTTQNKL